MKRILLLVTFVLLLGGMTHATKFIRDDATGGDCTLIGTWDAATKTCILTTDVFEDIQIDSNGITLDGGGHNITGSFSGSGITFSRRSDIVVKNLIIQRFSSGISIFLSNNSNLTGNTIIDVPGDSVEIIGSSNIILSENEIKAFIPFIGSNGVFLENSFDNILVGNIIIGPSDSSGIFMSSANNNIIANNLISLYDDGIFMDASNKNIIVNNNIYSNTNEGIEITGSNNNVLTRNSVYNNNNNGISIVNSNYNNLDMNEVFSNDINGIYIVSSNNNDLTGNSAYSNSNSGVMIFFSNFNAFYNNQFYSNSNHGTFLERSNTNTFEGNEIYSNGGNGINLIYGNNNLYTNDEIYGNNGDGLWITSSDNNTIRNNEIYGNGFDGIYFLSTSENTVNNNSIYSNYIYGIFIDLSSDTTIFNNNFINNEVYVRDSSNIAFDKPLPVGGNYWSNYDTPAEGCNDLDSNNICDTPFVFGGGQDNLPWNIENGWSVPRNLTKKDSWQLRQDHFKVIIDPGHGFYKSSDPFSDNPKKRMNYSDRPVMFILSGLVRSQKGGKAFRGPGIPRTDFDYTEEEGTIFFGRALKEKFDEMNISHDFTRDLAVPFNILLGSSNLSVRRPNANNDWRHASVPYLKSIGKVPHGKFPENQDGNINIRYTFANKEQQNDSTKDFVFISLHSNAGASSRRGTVTGWVSNGKILNQLSESKKAFATFVHNNVIQEIRRNVSAAWINIGVVDARTSPEFNVVPGVLRYTQIPSALIEIAFHSNVEDLKFLNYTNLTTKRVVGDGIYNGIIKYFNSSVDSYDAFGNKKNSFSKGQNVYAKGTGFPTNKNVTIFITKHRDITKNEWNRTVKFSSVRVRSLKAKTDAIGNLPLTKVWTANATGSYDIVVAIYNTTQFHYVDALDDLTGVPGFTVT